MRRLFLICIVTLASTICHARFKTFEELIQDSPSWNNPNMEQYLQFTSTRTADLKFGRKSYILRITGKDSRGERHAYCNIYDGDKQVAYGDIYISDNGLMIKTTDTKEDFFGRKQVVFGNGMVLRPDRSIELQNSGSYNSNTTSSSSATSVDVNLNVNAGIHYRSSH